MNIVKFQGIPIELSGKEYTLPPLSPYAYAKFGASKKLKQIQEEANKFQETQDIGAFSEESFMNIIELTTLALRRNHPEITEDDVGDGLTEGMGIIKLMRYLVTQEEEVQKQMDEQIKNALKQSTKKNS